MVTNMLSTHTAGLASPPERGFRMPPVRVMLCAVALSAFAPRLAKPQSYDLCDVGAIASFVDKTTHKGGRLDCKSPVAQFLPGCLDEPALKSRRTAMMLLVGMCKDTAPVNYAPPTPGSLPPAKNRPHRHDNVHHFHHKNTDGHKNLDLCDVNAIKAFVATTQRRGQPDCTQPVVFFLGDCVGEPGLASVRSAIASIWKTCHDKVWQSLLIR